MITGTFNGLNVVSVPSSKLSTIELTMNDKVVATPGAFSQAAQTLDWQIDFWTGRISLPPMLREVAQPWMAFLADCRGMANCFLIGDPSMAKPLGQASGVPVTAGANATRSNLLNIRGFKPNQFRQLLAGNHFQMGSRLYMTIDDVNVDGAGDATIRVWPRIREAPADGTPIILRSPKGMFRLDNNQRKYSLANAAVYSIDITFTEFL